MEVTAVHQVLPALHVADASGSHTLRAREALREAGFASELFVDQVDPALSSEARPFADLDEFARERRTVLLYQLAVGSRLVDPLLRRREPLFVNYHNLTPADFYWEWAPDWLSAVELGRLQLHQLAPRVSHAIAVSRFNEQDLIAAGYSSTSVVAPFVDVGACGDPEPPHEEPERRGRSETGAARWLFVGKLLPHKAAHDLVKALAAYRSAYDARATLLLVGGHPVPAYAEAVRAYAAALGLGEAVRLAGSVGEDELSRAYTESDVFVCLSDHEGFCFPLLEAMQHSLPVVAFDAGAVGDTAAGSAVVLRSKDPFTVAAAVHRVLGDSRLHRRLVARGKRRVAQLGAEVTKREFVAAIRRGIERT